ncbi:MAG: peptide ABC transporter permease [Ignavibacteriae bacterium HGW-Ignavibacteriae-2]|jgi:putative ABC transport system permease protein|nr:ABC transporter permease [Bacteroidota bacterium]PKL89727.1 MAG: peptide ABC transporter permease [Ignavibacteriae bacterium HGW-Ignavibacteriae-2]
MNLIEIVRVSLQSLYTNKLRSALTILGIVVGIFSIIAVSTVITMLQNSIEEGISFFGKNTFQVQKWPAVRTGGPGEWAKYRNRKDITMDDFEHLQRLMTGAIAVSSETGRGGRVVKFGSEKTNPNVRINGVTPESFITRDWNVDKGRALNHQDINSASRVVILGTDVVEKLFKGLDPIGQDVRMDNYKLKVVGVLEKQGDIFGESLDNFAIIPISTFGSFFGDRRRSVGISVMAPSKEEYPDLMVKAEGHMRTVRKVPPGEENDFEIISNDSILSQINDITYNVRIGAFAIATIALLAAGIGIMNIMLVSVTERTKEIGIRKSIGAKKMNILNQFIIEAITLCLIGGFIGIVLGIGTGNFVGSFLNAKATIPLDWVAIGVFICIVIGVGFGTYPAYKAANLDPIEALRYE